VSWRLIYPQVLIGTNINLDTHTTGAGRLHLKLTLKRNPLQNFLNPNFGELGTAYNPRQQIPPKEVFGAESKGTI